MRSSARIPLAIAACYLAALVGFLTISPMTSAWYQALNKPTFFPPHIVFEIVWPILYTIMAIALIAIWPLAKSNRDAHGWVRLFFVHLIINAAWTIFFFALHAMFIAFVDSVFLFIAVGLLFMGAAPLNRSVSYLLIPYLMWVGFAAYLNAAIWILN